MQFIRPQRTGLIILIVLVAALQGILLWNDKPVEVTEVKGELPPYWAQLEKNIAEKTERQQALKDTIYPFNPNYLTDYRAYKLGIGDSEFDKLLAFRAQGKFVNSAAEFQKVTGISDSLLAVLQVYFRFPDWVRQSQPTQQNSGPLVTPSVPIAKTDLNQADKQQLMRVYGIGDKLSDRIIAFRSRIGGFAADFQLYDIVGLDSVTVQNLMKSFTVMHPPAIEKRDVNTATYDELRAIPYLSNFLARQIITYRQNHGPINNLEELTKIQDFPTERLRSLSLYLYVKKL